MCYLFNEVLDADCFWAQNHYASHLYTFLNWCQFVHIHFFVICLVRCFVTDWFCGHLRLGLEVLANGQMRQVLSRRTDGNGTRGGRHGGQDWTGGQTSENGYVAAI